MHPLKELLVRELDVDLEQMLEAGRTFDLAKENARRDC